MSREERTGWRDELFSKWHRQIESRNVLKCVDGDWNEYCAGCSETLAMFELCANYSKTDKVATVTQKRAARLDIPAWLVLYYGGEYDGRVRMHFRIRRLHPDPADEFVEIPETQMARLIWNAHAYCKYCGRREKLPVEIAPIPRFSICIHRMQAKDCKLCNGTVRRMIKEMAS